MQDNNLLIQRCLNQMVVAAKTTPANQMDATRFDMLNLKMDSLLEQLYQLTRSRQ